MVEHLAIRELALEKQMTAKDPFDFLDASPVEFFDEGSWDDSNLLTRHYDPDLAFGAVKTLIEGARKALAGVPSEGVRPILRFGDILLQAGACEGLLRNERDETLEWTREVALKVSHLDLLPLILEPLRRNSFLLQDSELGFEPFEVTPERFCAAYVLRATFSALDFGYTAGLDDLPICYLMQASAVYGYLTVLASEPADPVRQIVVSDAKTQSARSMACNRWSKDPHRVMWASIFSEWSRWRGDRSTMPKPSDFRRAMQLRFPDLVDGTLKNKMSLWERQFRNDASTVSRYP